MYLFQILAAIGVDFFYYWVHRAAHGEDNILSHIMNIFRVLGTSQHYVIERNLTSHK